MKNIFRQKWPVLALLAAGFLYFLWFSLAGLGLPCPFYTVTGFYCPGCGITRSLTALFHLQILEALRYNAAIILLLPFLIWLLLCMARKKPLTKRQNLAVWFAIGGLLIFGVLRNLPAFPFLRPPL